MVVLMVTFYGPQLCMSFSVWRKQRKNISEFHFFWNKAARETIVESSSFIYAQCKLQWYGMLVSNSEEYSELQKTCHILSFS